MQSKKGDMRLNDDNTLDKSNKLLYPHVEVTRILLKLKVPAAQNKREATMHVMKELFTQLKKVDKSIQIYTWAEDNKKLTEELKRSQRSET